jgi:tRNA-specific 2-thiouridylase
VGKVHLPDFLQQRLQQKRGKVIAIPPGSEVFKNGFDSDDLKNLTASYSLADATGEVIGEHKGAHYYTIGQRKGLNIGGNEKPLFVIGTNTTENIIYTGLGEDHPGLYRKGLFIENKNIHWVRADLTMGIGASRKYEARVRYRQSLVPCTLHRREEGLFMIFDTPQKSITPGQFAAWYNGEELVGSGIID